MSTSTVATVFTDGVGNLWDYLSAILPIVIPVVIGLSFLYGIYYFFFRRGRV